MPGPSGGGRLPNKARLFGTVRPVRVYVPAWDVHSGGANGPSSNLMRTLGPHIGNYFYAFGQALLSVVRGRRKAQPRGQGAGFCPSSFSRSPVPTSHALWEVALKMEMMARGPSAHRDCSRPKRTLMVS